MCEDYVAVRSVTWVHMRVVIFVSRILHVVSERGKQDQLHCGRHFLSICQHPVRVAPGLWAMGYRPAVALCIPTVLSAVFDSSLEGKWRGTPKTPFPSRYFPLSYNSTLHTQREAILVWMLGR